MIIVAEAKISKGCFYDENGVTTRDFEKAKTFNSKEECSEWLLTKKGGNIFKPNEYEDDYLEKLYKLPWMAWRKNFRKE